MGRSQVGRFVVSTTDSSIRPALVVSVQCTSWQSFAEQYASDLARGALCLAYPEPLPLLSTLTVKLTLPDSVAITLSARVVQVLSGTLADQLNSPFALALEVLDLEGEVKQQLAKLLEFARSQREHEDAQTSFARTMLDGTPSLPPREVALRLSQLPGAQAAATAARASQPQATSASGFRHATAARRLHAGDTTRPLSPSRTMRAIRGKGADLDSAAPSGSEPAAAPDPDKLKDLLSNVARKRYDTALQITNELLEANPTDRHVQRWRALCYARIALSRDDHALAAQAYATMLEIEPSDREAGEFLKHYERSKRLESLPFGRFFTKKK